MKREKLQKSMGLIEDEFIEEAAPYNAKPMTSLARASINIKRLAILAACVAIIAGAVIGTVIYNVEKNPIEYEQITSTDESEDFPPIPIYDDAQYSAEYIANFFGTYKIESTATSSYRKIYVPDAKHLNLKPFEYQEYITTYEKTTFKLPLDKNEFSVFVDDIFTRLCPALEIDIPKYNIDEASILNNKLLKVEVNDYEDLFIYVYQSSFYYVTSLNSMSREDPSITLSGTKIEIDQRKTDEEIKKDLQPIKETLSSVFGVEFNDIKITRSYNSHDTSRATWIYVYFYDEDAHPLNNEFAAPVSDFIELSFDNFQNSPDEIVSDDILNNVDITYRHCRQNPNEKYRPVEQLKMITLEDAEALLYNGYVFGGHSCHRCMAAQEKILFDDYDFVEIEYVSGYDENTEIIPFYAFYKYIGDAENGNKIYAKTYVPAIEVYGYEEYFEAQEKNHVDISESTEDE